ncbi:MAG: dienelactone hydrolase family protein [Methylacidiphilales bacterium]|nr:dienelactone hydrolase family protein [Candidatus Methylacidiphilales bacterium]
MVYLQNKLHLVILWLLTISFGEAQIADEIVVNTRSDDHPTIAFDYWVSQGDVPANQVLLLIPGYNGSGPRMFTPQWRDFADKYRLVLLAPTFTTNMEELKNHQGYYYPDQWSGDATEDALAELGRRENVSTDKILIFGFSAGAHFAHGFALWKPDQVKAFVAYSAAWWDDPTEQLASVPALIMCGEADPRYDATWQFMDKGQALNLPWVWRSYEGTGHEMTAAVQRMAEAFLGHYASGEPDSPYYGDIQSYRYVTPDKMESIPPQERIRLPSKAIAEQWMQEN